MRDVAKVAGVSVATVSHVVNDKKGARIGDDARRRVHEAVIELGYRPNALAKTLSQGTSRFIGLVADAIATTPFAGQIIHGAQDEAWKHGYVLLVANTDGNEAAENEAIAMMLEHQVHGILYSTWYHREIQVPEALHETDTVLVDCFAEGSGLPAVVPDEEQGGRTATEELLAAGHRRIAFINTTTPSPAQTGRLAGYRAALEAAGVAYDESLVFPAAPEQEGGYAATSDDPRLEGDGRVLPQRPRGDGPLRRAARARPAHSRGCRRDGLRQPGRHRSPPAPDALDGRAAALRTRRRRRAAAARSGTRH